MYSFEEKEEVIKQFKGGRKIEYMHEATGIPIDTLILWKEEADLRLRIKNLIKASDYEEAKKEIEKLNSPDNDIIKFTHLKRIAYLEGDIEGEKNNLREILKRNPNDIKVIREASSNAS